MRVARRLAADRAQPEPLGGVVAGRLEPPVIEGQNLGTAPFQEQLAVIRPGHRVAQNGGRAPFVERRCEGTKCLTSGGVWHLSLSSQAVR